MVALITTVNSDDADDDADEDADHDADDADHDDADWPPSEASNASFKALMGNYGHFDKGGRGYRVTGRPKIWHC